MQKSIVIPLFVFFLILSACTGSDHSSQLPDIREVPFITDDGISGIARLDSIDVTINQIRIYRQDVDSLIEESRTMQPFSIFRFYGGRVDEDEYPDLVLGVIKRNQFDSELRKRLFIYSIREFEVEPRWLGTYLAHELIDFKVVTVDSLTHFITLEKVDDNSFAVLEYNWVEFGPVLLDYRVKGDNYEEVQTYFDTVH